MDALLCRTVFRGLLLSSRTSIFGRKTRPSSELPLICWFPDRKHFPGRKSNRLWTAVSASPHPTDLLPLPHPQGDRPDTRQPSVPDATEPVCVCGGGGVLPLAAQQANRQRQSSVEKKGIFYITISPGCCGSVD